MGTVPTYTKDVTAHARNLGFAGVAVCWLFKTDKWTFPDWIYWALLAFVAYFIFDILQALSGAFMLKRFLEKHEEMMWEQDDAVFGGPRNREASMG